MTLKYYFGNIVRGLSSDTKPTNVPSGSIFVETDTGDIYTLVAGVWVKSNTFVSSDIEVYPYSTTIGDYTTPTNAYGTEATVTISTTVLTQADLRSGIMTRYAEKITDINMRNKRIISVSVYLQKIGTPASGLISVTLRKTSDDSVVGTFGTLDPSLVATGSWQLFTFSTAVISPNEDFRICVEKPDAGSDNNTNKIVVGIDTGNPYAGGVESWYNAGWSDGTLNDMCGKFIYTTESTANPATNAIDGNTATRFESPSEVGPTLKLELSSAADKEPAALALMTHTNTTATQLKIECSDDNSTWVLARTVNVNLLTHGSYNYFRFNRGTKAFRYIRIKATDAGAVVLAVSEVKVLVPSESMFNRRHGHKAIANNDGTVALNA